MKCNLVKEAKQLKLKDGGSKTIFNYYLVFENGAKLPILVRLYETEKIADSKKAALLEKVNFSNSQLIYTLADSIGEK